MMKKAPYQIPKSKQIRVIVDTDCNCEADDQFALLHQLMTPKFAVQGVCAEHYGDGFGSTVEANEAASYQEAQKIVDMAGLHDQVKVYHGCTARLPDEHTPVESEASRFIVEEAMRDDPRPLFVTCQGAVTNLASAYLMNPEIGKRITVVWIGGGAYPQGEWEFNSQNDIHATNVVMDSDMELWQVPCNVYGMMKVSLATLYDRVWPCGEMGKYLVEHMFEVNEKFTDMIGGAEPLPGYTRGGTACHQPGGETWVLGDSPVAGLMLLDHEGCFTTQPAPRVEAGTGRYLARPDNPRQIRVYHSIDSQFILEDFYAKMHYYFG